MLRRAVVTALIVSIATPSVAEARWNHPMPYDWYVDLAHCESGTGPDTPDVPITVGPSYTGYFGIHRQTWRRWADSPSARGKTFAAQARVVDRIAWFGHTERGERVWPVGPYGWGSIKANCRNLATRLCHSRHPIVRRKARNC